MARKKLTNDEYQALWNEVRERVRDALHIDDVMRELKGVTLKGLGETLSGKCPFHEDKSPSLSVNRAKGLFYCFGCQFGGDVFKLIGEHNNCDFGSAVRIGARMAGIEIPSDLGALSKSPRTPKKAAPRAPENPIAAVRDLPRCDMVAIPSGFPRPQPNQWFAVWNPGRATDLSDRGRKAMRPVMVHEYRNVDNDLLCMIVRQEYNGRKIFQPLRHGEVPIEEGHRNKRPKDQLCTSEGKGLILAGAKEHHLRPVYGMEHVRDWIEAGGNRVLIIEGEKTCDAARRLLAGLAGDEGEKWLVLTPMGGGGGARYADFSGFAALLASKVHPVPEFFVFPDADKLVKRHDGTTMDKQDIYARQIMTNVLQHFHDAGLDTEGVTMNRVIPPASVKPGWDLADAEAEGWSSETVLEFIHSNFEAIDMAKLNVLKNDEVKLETDLGVSGTPSPFDPTEPDLSIFNELIGESIADEAMRTEPAVEALTGGYEILADETGSDSETYSLPAIEMDGEDQGGEDIIFDDEDDDETDEERLARDPIGYKNTHFRCLGYLEGVNYFMSLDSGQIYSLTPANMRSTAFLHLAPLEWFTARFPSAVSKHGTPTGVSWDSAISAMVQKVYAAGVWDPEREVGQGARLDQNRVVFNTGKMLIVNGKTRFHPRDFKGDFVYTIGASVRAPNIDTPFEAGAPEVRKFLSIIKSLDWREDTRQISSMALFGWIAVSPICGILPWRPHLWLDGPRGAGKSWIINNLIAPALSPYRFLVKSNSTESGIRNMLHSRALPLIFDEAEGEDGRDKIRMTDIIKLARHSATEGDSVVAQGTPGGQGQRHFSIASTFLLSSITPQLARPADRTRFARANLSGGLDLKKFVDAIEGPAAELLTPDFSDRLLGRMLGRAVDYRPVYRRMVEALAHHPGDNSKPYMERRIADVYGTFAAGAWLLLRDGVPASAEDAYDFIAEEFGVTFMRQMEEFNSDISDDKDHDRVFSAIFSSEKRFDSRNGGQRIERIGTLIMSACGLPVDDDVVMDPEEAAAILRGIGLRPGKRDDRGATACAPGEEADCLLIHKKAPPIMEILEKTPYAVSYGDVMKQSKHVKTSLNTVRFGALGVDKPLIVDIAKLMA